jgi:hypothetical protein
MKKEKKMKPFSRKKNESKHFFGRLFVLEPLNHIFWLVAKQLPRNYLQVKDTGEHINTNFFFHHFRLFTISYLLLSRLVRMPEKKPSLPSDHRAF